MDTRIDEIADGIYRLSTLLPEVAPPAGFTFNQFLIRADEPLLFHCGHRAMFPMISAAVAKVVPMERLRWIGFSHLEADECGSMNQWLAAAPRATVVHGMLGCAVSLNDMADRPPMGLADGETLDLGGKRGQNIDTPHVPHGWDAGLLYEESTGTLLCSDLLAQVGHGPALLQEHDLLGAAIEAENMFRSTSLTPDLVPTLRRLAALKPRTLAVMHGSSFSGDGAAMLGRLADHYEERIRETSSGADT